MLINECMKCHTILKNISKYLNKFMKITNRYFIVGIIMINDALPYYIYMGRV